MEISSIWDFLSYEEFAPTDTSEIFIAANCVLDATKKYLQKTQTQETLFARKEQVALVIREVEDFYKTTAKVYDENTTVSKEEKVLLQNLLYRLDTIWDYALKESKRLEQLPKRSVPSIIPKDLQKVLSQKPTN